MSGLRIPPLFFGRGLIMRAYYIWFRRLFNKPYMVFIRSPYVEILDDCNGFIYHSLHVEDSYLCPVTGDRYIIKTYAKQPTAQKASK